MPPATLPRTSSYKSNNQVFAHDRNLTEKKFRVPAGIRANAPNKMDGIAFLESLPTDTFSVCFLDPQYRGVLDKQKYGNEGSRQKARSSLPQMSDDYIQEFTERISRTLMPSGHLFLWTDKFHLCTGIQTLLGCELFQIVDLITWNKKRIGMGYRTRRTSEYLIVLQKRPARAKGVWTLHDIPDVWDEKVDRTHAHSKPVGLQAKLIEAVSCRGDYVIDPAAGSYSVLAAAKSVGRNFIGCDIVG